MQSETGFFPTFHNIYFWRAFSRLFAFQNKFDRFPATSYGTAASKPTVPTVNSEGGGSAVTPALLSRKGSKLRCGCLLSATRARPKVGGVVALELHRILTRVSLVQYKRSL